MTSPTRPATLSLRGKAVVAGAILAAFTAFSLWVVAGRGYFGFLTLARDEPWGLQVLLDLVIACSFGLGWLAQDARKRGITSWPYFIVTPFVGSMSLLAYVIHRGFARPR
jgi:hypothetical protein